jgi:hypothetical protein
VRPLTGIRLVGRQRIHIAVAEFAHAV